MKASPYFSILNTVPLKKDAHFFPAIQGRPKVFLEPLIKITFGHPTVCREARLPKLKMDFYCELG